MIQNNTTSWSAQQPLKPLAAFLVTFIFVLGPWIYSKVTPSKPAGCKRLGGGRTRLVDQYDTKYESPPRLSSSNSDGTHSHDAGGITLNEVIGHVKSLHIFPIKSCAGVEAEKLQVTRTGPKHDRQFAFARYHTHKFGEKTLTGWNKITQREFPRLALVEPQVWVPYPSEASSGDSSAKEHVKNGGCLVVSFPRRVSFTPRGVLNFLASLLCKVVQRDWHAVARYTFELPLDPSGDRIRELKCPLINVQIWADTASGVDLRSLVPHHILLELKSFLGVEEDFAVFRTDPENYRKVFRNAPRADELGYQASVGFADAYPLNLLNLASVRDVASYLPPSFGRLDARRFRTNVLVTGPPAYSEDDWIVATIGSSPIQFHLADHTTRCQLPNVDPTNGKVAKYKLPWHAEPLNALLRKQRSRNPAYMEPLKAMRDPDRANRCIDRGASDKACLGMQTVPKFSALAPTTNGNDNDQEDKEKEVEEIWLSVGDEIRVLETGDHVFVSK